MKVPFLKCRDRQPVKPAPRLGLDPVGEGGDSGGGGVPVDRIGRFRLTLQGVDEDLLGGGGPLRCRTVGVGQRCDGATHHPLGQPVAHCYPSLRQCGTPLNRPWASYPPDLSGLLAGRPRCAARAPGARPVFQSTTSNPPPGASSNTASIRPRTSRSPISVSNGTSTSRGHRSAHWPASKRALSSARSGSASASPASSAAPSRSSGSIRACWPKRSSSQP